jgi:hypothetical protein
MSTPGTRDSHHNIQKTAFDSVICYVQRLFATFGSVEQMLVTVCARRFIGVKMSPGSALSCGAQMNGQKCSEKVGIIPGSWTVTASPSASPMEASGPLPSVTLGCALEASVLATNVEC